MEEKERGRSLRDHKGEMNKTDRWKRDEMCMSVNERSGEKEGEWKSKRRCKRRGFFRLLLISNVEVEEKKNLGI